MKTLVLAGFLAITISAQAQDFMAPLPRVPVEPPPPRVAPPAGIEGAIPRAIRSGNPLQMINPFAPREYGTGEALVYFEQEDPFFRPPLKQARPVGITLFSVTFW